MVYFIVKCTLSGIIIGVVSEVAKRPGFWRAHRVITIGFPLGHCLAVERYWGCGAYRRTRRIDLLVRPTISTDVSGAPCNVAGRRELLAQFGGKLRDNRGALSSHGVGAG